MINFDISELNQIFTFRCWPGMTCCCFVFSMSTNQELRDAVAVIDLELSEEEPGTPSPQNTPETEEESPLSVATNDSSTSPANNSQSEESEEGEVTDSDTESKTDPSDKESRPDSRAEYEDDLVWGIVPDPYPGAPYPSPYRAVMDGVEWWPIIVRPELTWRPLDEQVALGPMWWFAPQSCNTRRCSCCRV